MRRGPGKLQKYLRTPSSGFALCSATCRSAGLSHNEAWVPLLSAAPTVGAHPTHSACRAWQVLFRPVQRPTANVEVALPSADWWQSAADNSPLRCTPALVGRWRATSSPFVMALLSSRAHVSSVSFLLAHLSMVAARMQQWTGSPTWRHRQTRALDNASAEALHQAAG